MLHVFYLDAGRMLTYDVHYAAETVSSLNEAICNSAGAPLTEQILLISGGEVLESNRKVSSYSAGMDSSNPIFLICRTDVDGQNARIGLNVADSQAGRDLESLLMKQQPTLPPTYQTIQMNLQLAKKFAAVCDEDYNRCSQLVNDQHLIHQGWCAVIANLDDTTNAFRQRNSRYRERHDKFLIQKNKAGDLLKNFSQDLTLLKRIPLLNCLIGVVSSSSIPAAGAIVDAQANSNHGTSSTSSSMSLFDWISSKEPESSLNELADETRKTFEQILDSKIVENLIHWETVTLERVQDSQMKEIKGLGRRLDQLNEYFEHVKKIRLEQNQYVEMIAHQEQQALTTRDTSILSQLCISQSEVLKVLSANQKRLTDISRRFFEAKNELLKNIRVRLQWVSDTHQIIHTADNKVLLNGERLRKLRRQLELLRQLHDAPVVYASAVSEVLRRKSFSREFLEWTERLVSKSRALHADENRLRDLFSEKLDRHFLRSLFQGMDDKAPNFCTEQPEPFDAELPPIEIHHVREIRQSVPQLASLLQVCQPQVCERMMLTDWKTDTMRRDVSFFSQTPPKYVQMAYNRSCQSPSWMSGDEFSPNTVGVLFQQTNDSNPTSGAEDGDSQVGDLPYSSITPRSAPIKIPSRAPSDIMTSSRQFSEKSSRFGTPDEGTLEISGGGSAPNPNDRRISSPNLREIAHMTQSMIGRVCQMNDVPPLGELALEKSGLLPDILNRSSTESSLAQQKLIKLQSDLEEKMKLLNESSERVSVLENRLKESEVKILAVETARRESELALKKQCTKLCDNVRQLSSTFRETLNQIRSSLTTFSQTSRDSTDNSTTVLLVSAKRLEKNLQNSLAEAEKATSAVKEDEFERRMNEIRDELEGERQKFRDCQRQMENIEAYLKQKDEVIELLQQKLNENEQQGIRKVEETKSEIIKQLMIEQELDLEALRRDFQSQLDMKDNESRHLLNELREKDLVVKQMRREQDRLVASVYEREMNGGDDSPDPLSVELKRLKEDEFEERLKQIKHDLELSYKDKLQKLTAGLEQKHIQQIERLRVEKDVELRMLKEQHQRDRQNEVNKHREELTSIDVPSTLTLTNTTLSNAVDESYYAVVDTEPRRSSDIAIDSETVFLQESNVQSVVAKSRTDECAPVVTPDSVDVSIMQESQSSPAKISLASETFSSSSNKPRLTICTQTRPDNRISVLRLQVGDLILLVFDQKVGSYVAFSVSTTFYVLKETSAQRMGLEKPKTSTNSAATSAAADATTSEMRTKWVFARLLESDFCQIKKPSNRYNLPLGTKFYRVSAERCEIVPKEEVKRTSK